MFSEVLKMATYCYCKSNPNKNRQCLSACCFPCAFQKCNLTPICICKRLFDTTCKDRINAGCQNLAIYVTHALHLFHCKALIWLDIHICNVWQHCACTLSLSSFYHLFYQCVLYSFRIVLSL